MIEAEGINIRRGDVKGFSSPLSFTWLPGRIYAVAGPNGSGKTTLLNIVSGLEFPTEGRLTVTKREGLLNGSRKTPKILSYVMQKSPAPDVLRIGEYVRLAGLPRLRDAFLLAAPFLAETGKLVRSLSGGERQFLGNAVGLSCEASIYLLDEPFRGLAPGLVAFVATACVERARMGALVAVVEHDERVLRREAEDAGVRYERFVIGEDV